MNSDITRLGYRELAERYDLGTVKFGGDLQRTETGDLKVLHGDLQLGDITHNALHRFVVAWQFNAPMLKTTFDFVIESELRQQKHKEELEDVAVRLGAARLTRESDAVLNRWHELQQEIGIDELGPQAYAGTVMVVVTSLLRLEWVNLGKPSRWNTSKKLLNGYSFGQIAESASNNFRHSDEWALTTVPTDQQLKSIGALAAVLSISLNPGGMRHPFGKNICCEVLNHLSGGTFEGLMDAAFVYARALAAVK